MRLIAPPGYTDPVRDANGALVPIVDGIVEMQDNYVPDCVWGFGFVVCPDPVAKKKTPVKDPE